MSFRGMLKHRCRTKRWFDTGTSRWNEPTRELRVYLRDVPCLFYSPQVRELNRTAGTIDITEVWCDVPPEMDVINLDQVEAIGPATELFGYDTFEVIGIVPAGGMHHKIVRLQQVTA